MNDNTCTTLLTAKEVAVIFGITEHTLAVWRCENRYPLKYVKIGRYIRYQIKDVEAYIDSQTREGVSNEYL